MDKSKLAIAGAVSALLSAGQAAGAVLPADPAPPARSFAELLAPIPRALERLPIAQAIDEARADDGGAEPLVIDGVLRGAPLALEAGDGEADAKLVLVSQRAGRSNLHRRHLPLHRRHIVARHHRQT